MADKCGNCQGKNVYLKMATSKLDGNQWVTKRYYICKKCRAVTVDVLISDKDNKFIKSDVEVYTEDYVDYSDINDIKILTKPKVKSTLDLWL